MISMTLTDLEGFNIGTEFSPLNCTASLTARSATTRRAVSLLFEAPEPSSTRRAGAPTRTCC